MIEKQEILKRMLALEEYFHRQADDNQLFTSEFECARTIRLELEKSTHLTTEVAERILKVYNETNIGGHYSGSGWLDYQLHLAHLFSLHRFKVEVDERTGSMKIGAGGKSLHIK